MSKRFLNIPLNPLRVFAVAAQHRTFTAAAQEMGVSQVAVSRQITILENFIGVKLFERSARSVKLTDTGRRFARDVYGAFEQIEDATRGMLSAERESTVNLRLYPTFAHHWLMPRLSGFLESHPDTRVRLDTAVKPLDFRSTHLDVAIQLGDGTWRDSRSRKLFDEVVDVVCSPSYLARMGDGFGLADLSRAEVLHSKYRRREWQSWSEANNVAPPQSEGLEFETSLLTYSAAQQGLGLAIGQIDLLGHELSSSLLVRPFRDTAYRTGAAFHVVWPTLASATTSTRRFIDWLLISAGESAEFFRSGGSGVSADEHI